MRRASGLAAVLLLLVVTPLLGSGDGAQTIHAGRLLDVGEGSLSSDVLIRIENGVITGIVDAGESEIPADVLDLSDYIVLPGLIDVHTHLCDNTWLGEEFDHWALPAPAFGVVGTVNARKVLRAGFTTIRNVSEPYYCGLALRDTIARGWTEGPRIFASGPIDRYFNLDKGLLRHETGGRRQVGRATRRGRNDGPQLTWKLVWERRSWL